MRPLKDALQKAFKSPPLNLDPTCQMLPARLHHDRYNFRLKAHALMISGGSHVHAIEVCDAATSHKI